VVVGDLEHRAKKKIQILSVNMLAPMSDAKLTHMLKQAVPPPRRVSCAFAIEIAQDLRHRALTQIHFFLLKARFRNLQGDLRSNKESSAVDGSQDSALHHSLTG
jgi:hypothetical protein